MSLIEALKNKGYEKSEIRSIIIDWSRRILAGENPEELLLEEYLESDYVFDLLDYCLALSEKGLVQQN